MLLSLADVFTTRVSDSRPLQALTIVALALCALAAPARTAPPVETVPPTGPIAIGHVEGAIGPATTVYIQRLLANAEAGNARCLILTLDTPGGLADAMREIIQVIFASPVPVVTFVHPEGARAASAGALIALAAHVSAMAPGTNIGAAHPVSIGSSEAEEGGTMDEKVTNDAAAYARSIAARRGRDVKWAERAVRESISSTAEEAVAAGVVDVIARDITDLVAKLDGRRVETGGEARTLETDGAALAENPPTLRERFLARISDPNIAYLLMLAGVFGVIFELQNPGSILPGVVGAVSLLTAAFALQMLPVNWAGAALLLLSLVLFILEVKVPSHGILTIGAIVAMVFGSLMLIDSPFPFMRVSLAVIIPSVAFTALFFLFAVGMGVRAQRRRVTTGHEGLIGLEGTARGNVDARGGSVFVRGEIWNAESDEAIADGSRVEVVRVNGLMLKVRGKQSLS
jgi:membrane-bound serine protease (ClpP class)